MVSARAPGTGAAAAPRGRGGAPAGGGRGGGGPGGGPPRRFLYTHYTLGGRSPRKPGPPGRILRDRPPTRRRDPGSPLDLGRRAVNAFVARAAEGVAPGATVLDLGAGE